MRTRTARNGRGATTLLLTALASVTILAIITAAARPVAAQDPAPEELESAASEVVPGAWVLVTDLDGTEVQGRVTLVDGGSMTLEGQGGEEHVVTRGEVREIRVRRSRARSFAKGGAVAGGLVMGATSAYVIGQICSGSTDCGPEAGLAVVLGVGVGVLGGALLGALMGAAAPEWTEASPAGWERTPPSVRVHLGLQEALSADGPSVGVYVSLPLPR